MRRQNARSTFQTLPTPPGIRSTFRFNTMPANVRKDFMTSTPAYSGPTPSRLQVLRQGFWNLSFKSSDTDEAAVQTDNVQQGSKYQNSDIEKTLVKSLSKVEDATGTVGYFEDNSSNPASSSGRQKHLLSSLPATVTTDVGPYGRSRFQVHRDYIPERDSRKDNSRNMHELYPHTNKSDASWKWNPKQYKPRFYIDDSFNNDDTPENIMCRSQSTVKRSAMYNLSGYFPNISHVNSSIFCKGDLIMSVLFYSCHCIIFSSSRL